MYGEHRITLGKTQALMRGISAFLKHMILLCAKGSLRRIDGKRKLRVCGSAVDKSGGRDELRMARGGHCSGGRGGCGGGGSGGFKHALARGGIVVRVAGGGCLPGYTGVAAIEWGVVDVGETVVKLDCARTLDVCAALAADEEMCLGFCGGFGGVEGGGADGANGRS